jgi:hypothetical protein
MYPPNILAVGQARLDDLHEQARRDTLARAARRARRGQRRARRQRPGHRASGLLAAVARWARRPRPAPESS